MLDTFPANGGILSLIILIKKGKFKGEINLVTQGNGPTIKARPPLQGADLHTYDNSSLSTDSFSISYHS